jgi:hypothetical protein
LTGREKGFAKIFATIDKLMQIHQRIHQFLISLDQVINTLIWIEDTWADETISSKCHRLNHKPLFREAEKLINHLFFWEPDHCRIAFEAERKREQAPIETR